MKRKTEPVFEADSHTNTSYASGVSGNFFFTTAMESDAVPLTWQCYHLYSLNVCFGAIHMLQQEKILLL